MELVVLGGFGIVLAIIIALIYIKDSEVNRRFTRYERSIESIMQENFNLKKQIANLATFKDGDLSDLDQIEKDLQDKLDKDLNEKIVPIIKAIKSIERVIDEFASEQKDRMLNLEERTRDIGKITPNVQGEEEQIVRLFNSGKSIETIAKDLHIGIGRIEFVLKLHKLV
ncbi:hypothetical protein KDD93_01315 [Campylobacter sp. faydin G-24]|uniref:Periplasmic protein n=1 Tax=Campylobacter anatolicus TaxID=2829105 RepID=A0ABS5HG08_9BACT|nr:hypothetical protein [Campylobacter anatolicus]MBR8463214.1 hypothetical protein [Campylobacter anatolicus]MBR8465472.1 hypothetical protein [Campylobacter anatolicus]